MADDLNNYLHDLIYLYKEEYNAALEDSKSAVEKERAFLEGKVSAYYAALSLIENQLFAFDPDHPLIGKVAPEFGQKADL